MLEGDIWNRGIAMVNPFSLGRTQRTSIESAIRVLRHSAAAIGVAVDRVGALTYDSRESLRSEKQQLAGRQLDGGHSL